MNRRILLLAAAFAISPAVQAARPVPDRPYADLSGFLVSKGTLEMEAGGLWAGGFTVPFRLKYAAGRSFEPRVSANLAGFGGGDPDLALEGKFRFHRSTNTGVAGYLATALPVGGQPWDGRALVLLTTKLDRVILGANTGIALAGSDGNFGIAGVPMIVLVGTPFGSSMTGGLEASALVNSAIQDVTVDAGLKWTPTEIVAVDVVAGYRLEENLPFLGLGLTINLGTPGG